MIVRFFTEDFRQNKVEHVMTCQGAEYAESVLADKGCRRLTFETDKNYYTCDGVPEEKAQEVLDAAYNGSNVFLPDEYIFNENAKDSV